jgi:hypothetical protein
MKKKATDQQQAAPINFPRSDPTELAAFDPRTKECTMNCGPHSADPRSDKERKFQCDECLPVAPASTKEHVFRCSTCCAPAGQPCAPGCTEETLASAVNKAIGMLEALNVAKLPLGVAGAIGVLRCGLKAQQATDQAVSKGGDA